MINYINEETILPSIGGREMVEAEKKGKKVLIATLYSFEPVMVATTRLGPQVLFLLIDNEPNQEQTDSLKKIQEAVGSFIEIKPVKTEVYDIYKVAEKCVGIIDARSNDDLIYINITSGRKTKAIGLLFAAYARHDRIKKIAYNPEEDKTSVVYLPKLSFKLTESQKMVLEYVATGKYKTISDLSKEIKLSTAMTYRAIAELEDMDFISVENGLEITDAGKIARL
jgi:CRISPR locus-related DNA-binding protein